MKRRRGFTVLEVAIALSVISILLTAALGGVRAHQVSVAREMRTLEASRAASSRIEVLRARGEPLKAGGKAFTPDVKGAQGTQTVKEVEPGLQEVEVVVTIEDAGVRVSLVTWIAREVEP